MQTTGMDTFITALTSGITPAALWGALASAAALIIVAVVFSFGYHVIRRVISGIGKGKAKA